MSIGKVLFSAALILSVTGCLVEGRQGKIEALVKGPVRNKLYSADTKFNSIKIILDRKPTSSNSLDITYEHIWVLHITSETTVVFTGERKRASLCVNIGTNRDIDTVRVFGVVECPEKMSDKMISDLNVKMDKIVNQINSFK